MVRPGIALKDWRRFTTTLFANDDEGEQAAPILTAILTARSPQLTDIAQTMAGSPGANYKRLQRFLAKTEAKEALLRLFWEEAPWA